MDDTEPGVESGDGGVDGEVEDDGGEARERLVVGEVEVREDLRRHIPAHAAVSFDDVLVGFDGAGVVGVLAEGRGSGAASTRRHIPGLSRLRSDGVVGVVLPVEAAETGAGGLGAGVSGAREGEIGGLVVGRGDEEVDIGHGTVGEVGSRVGRVLGCGFWVMGFFRCGDWCGLTIFWRDP